MGINGLNPKILKKKEMFLRWFCSKDNEKMIFLGLFWYIKKKVATNAASIDGGSGRVSGHGVQSRYRHRLRRTGWHGEWQWFQSKYQVSAVPMVSVRAWQWQYWQRYGSC
jgi:hypothetical protein